MSIRYVALLCLVTLLTSGGRVDARPAEAEPPLKWTTVSTPHFMVLSAVEAETAQAWANDLERLRLGLSELVPVNTERLSPVVVVIFPSEKSFRPYKLVQKGKPAAIGGYFSRSDNLNVIGLAKDLSPGVTRRVIFHEATHWFLSARDEVLPLWMEEGVAELFSTFTADNRQFTLGATIPEHMRQLRADRLPGFVELLGVTRGELDYSDADRTARFYAGAWLFVHWANFGKNSPGPASLRRYLEALKSAADAEAAFTTAFGGNYATISKQLLAYLRSGKYERRRYPLPAGFASAPAPRPSTEAEIEFALGSLLLGSHGAEEALPRLRRATVLEPENPRGWEAVGSAELRAGRHAEALAALDRAARAGSRVAMVWHNRAALRQEAEQPAGGFLLTTDRTGFGPAAADFRHAIALDPHCQMAYAGLAGVTYGVEPADPEDLARFEQGLRLFPQDKSIALGRALTMLRSGNLAAGEAELKRMLDEDGHLPDGLRRLAVNALEVEKLQVLSGLIARYNRERRFGELVAELDRMLADKAINPTNRSSLEGMRRQADQMQRLARAVELFNAGARGEAERILRVVLDEGTASGELRGEAVRLLRICDPEAADRYR